MTIGNDAHQQRSHSTAHDAHNEQRRSDFSVCTKTTEGKSKEGGKHNAFAQIDHKKSYKSEGVGHEHHNTRGKRGNDGEDGQKTFGTNQSHGPTSAQTTQHEKSHSAKTQERGSCAVCDGDVLGGVVDEKTVDAGLCCDIEKEGYPPKDKGAFARETANFSPSGRR